MSKEIPFASQSLTVVEQIMKDNNISRKEAVKICLIQRHIRKS